MNKQQREVINNLYSGKGWKPRAIGLYLGLEEKDVEIVLGLAEREIPKPKTKKIRKPKKIMTIVLNQEIFDNFIKIAGKNVSKYVRQMFVDKINEVKNGL